MEPLVSGTRAGRTARDNDTVAPAYVAGYADGRTLLHSDGPALGLEHDQALVELLERTYARYFRYVELKPPTPEGRAYVAGFRDAVADNLPCPPYTIEPQMRRVAA